MKSSNPPQQCHAWCDTVCELFSPASTNHVVCLTARLYPAPASCIGLRRVPRESRRRTMTKWWHSDELYQLRVCFCVVCAKVVPFPRQPLLCLKALIVWERYVGCCCVPLADHRLIGAFRSKRSSGATEWIPSVSVELARVVNNQTAEAGVGKFRPRKSRRERTSHTYSVAMTQSSWFVTETVTTPSPPKQRGLFGVHDQSLRKTIAQA